MEDRYLFKAKRVDNGEWVLGVLFDGENHCIIGQEIKFSPYQTNECKIVGYEVDRNTICQCTDLKDKNCKMIWENDILYNGNYFVVKWNMPCARFDIVLDNSHNIPMGTWEPMVCDWRNNDFKEYRKAVDYEVIGNIFDNKELLESEG